MVSLSIAQKYNVHNVHSQLQWLDALCEQLFLLSYLISRTII